MRLPSWRFVILVLGVMLGLSGTRAGAAVPPCVSINWPADALAARAGTVIKLSADVTRGSGPIAFVQFFADTDLIGTVTNPPYEALWTVALKPQTQGVLWGLSAVAVDSVGLRGASPIVRLWTDGAFGATSVVEITSPRSGALFAAPAKLSLTAELFGCPYGYADPLDFIVGTRLAATNPLGIVKQADTKFSLETPPYVLTVTNLAEGAYTISVTDPNATVCWCEPVRIRVTKLGIQQPSLTSDGRVRFGVVTSFPGNPTVIESSPDLTDWSPIATNVPPTNTFTFTDPSPATNGTRFYRAVIPSQ